MDVAPFSKLIDHIWMRINLASSIFFLCPQNLVWENLEL